MTADDTTPQASAETPADQSATVPMHKHATLRTVLRDRERELLQLKGPCSLAACRLHHAHVGPCDIPPGSTR